MHRQLDKRDHFSSWQIFNYRTCHWGDWLWLRQLCSSSVSRSEPRRKPNWCSFFQLGFRSPGCKAKMKHVRRERWACWFLLGRNYVPGFIRVTHLVVTHLLSPAAWLLVPISQGISKSDRKCPRPLCFSGQDSNSGLSGSRALLSFCAPCFFHGHFELPPLPLRINSSQEVRTWNLMGEVAYEDWGRRGSPW